MDNDDIVDSLVFVRFLEKHDTVFLLHVLTTIFKFTDVLFDILQSKAFDVIYCKNKVDKVHSALVQMRNNNLTIYGIMLFQVSSWSIIFSNLQLKLYNECLRVLK